MAENLVLHIGTHKTGTTSIQAALRRAQEGLLEAGVLFPSAGRGPLDGHHNLVWGRRGDSRFQPDIGGLSDLIEEARSSEADTVIVSSETMTDGPLDEDLVGLAEDLVSALGNPTVHIQAYVRPQWDYIESNYVQLARRGLTALTFEEHVAHSLTHWRFDFRQVFGLWGERFSHSLHVGMYDSHMVNRFWDDVPALRSHSTPRLPKRRNPRAGRLRVGLMRQLRQDLDQQGLPRREIRECTERAIAFLRERIQADRPFAGLTERTAESIANSFRQGNVEFKARFLDPREGRVLLEPRGDFTPNEWALHEATGAERELYEDLIVHVRAGCMSERSRDS